MTKRSQRRNARLTFAPPRRAVSSEPADVFDRTWLRDALRSQADKFAEYLVHVSPDPVENGLYRAFLCRRHETGQVPVHDAHIDDLIEGAPFDDPIRLFNAMKLQYPLVRVEMRVPALEIFNDPSASLHDRAVAAAVFDDARPDRVQRLDEELPDRAKEHAAALLQALITAGFAYHDLPEEQQICADEAGADCEIDGVHYEWLSAYRACSRDQIIEHHLNPAEHYLFVMAPLADGYWESVSGPINDLTTLGRALIALEGRS